MKKYESKSKLCKIFAKKLNRSIESIRDRIKRYLNNLSKQDKNLIINFNNQPEEHYIHWI